MPAAIELVRDVIDALNRGDVEAMLARMHPAFEWTPLEASPVARVYTVRDGAATAMQEYATREQAVAALSR